MKKVRIGNDIAVEWKIYRLGEEETLQGKDIAVKLLDPMMKPVSFTYEIEGNKITGVFEGRNQCRTGAYTLLLVENCGQLHMNTIDECNFVQLVPHTFMEGGKDESSITTEKIDLSTDIEVPSNGLDGDSAYEIWIKQGHEGSESDFIAWLQQPAIIAANEVQDQMALLAEKEAVRNKAEQARQSAEKSREDAEEARIKSEISRERSESLRKEHDTMYSDNENERIQNEKQRQTDEARRVSNEKSRQDQESIRVTNENQRIKNESKRKSIVRTSKLKSEGLVDTYIIVYSDGSIDTFTVTNGKDADLNQVYTKAETDALLAGKASATSQVQMNYEEEPVEVDTNSAITLMSAGINNHIHDTDEALATKADKTEVYTKAESDERFANKGTTNNRMQAIEESVYGLEYDLNYKQDKLTAGANITIEGNVISASGGTPTKEEIEELIGGDYVPTSAIVQTTGQNTGKVMSQKAVTEAIAGAGGGKASVVLRPFDDVQTAYNMTAMDFATGTFTIDGAHDISVGDMVTIIPNFKVSRAYSNMVTQRLNKMVNAAYPCAAVTGIDGNMVNVDSFINASQSALTANQWLIVKRRHERVSIELPDNLKHKEISIRIQGFTSQTKDWNIGTIDVTKGTGLTYTNKITSDCGHGSYLDELCEFYMDRAIRYDMAAICQMDKTGPYRTNYVVVQGNSYNMADTDHISVVPNLCVYGNIITIKEL